MTDFTEIPLTPVQLSIIVPTEFTYEPLNYATEAPMAWMTQPEYTACNCGHPIMDCQCPPTPLGSITAPPYVTRQYEFPAAPYAAEASAEFGSVILTHGEITRVKVSSFRSLQNTIQLEEKLHGMRLLPASAVGSVHTIGVVCDKCRFPVDRCDCTCPEKVTCEKCLSYKCECKLLVEKFGHCAECMCPPETCACIFPLCDTCHYSRPYCECRPACKGCSFHPHYCECPEEPCVKCKKEVAACDCINYDDRDTAREEYDDEQFEEEHNRRHG